MLSQKPPEWLDKTGREYWRRITPALMEDGKLNAVTADLIAAAAQAYSTYRDALKHLSAEGRCVPGTTGVMKASPWLQVEKQAMDQLTRIHRLYALEGPVSAVGDALDQHLNG